MFMDMLSACSGAALFLSLFLGFPREIMSNFLSIAAEKIQALYQQSQFYELFGDHAQPNLN